MGPALASVSFSMCWRNYVENYICLFESNVVGTLQDKLLLAAKDFHKALVDICAQCGITQHIKLNYM